MSETGDRLAVFRGAAQTPDRRPSINTQAAIDAYDYRFAAWEVIDGADPKEVCRRLDVPGGPSVLGPKVVALRARLEACARVGRTPPERPTAPPARAVTHLSAEEAVALALGPTDKARPGIAFDATENPSASQMKGRALVTRSTAPSDEAPAVVPTDAPWREALTIKVSAAAVQAVAEQEGSDPVKALRAAGFAERAEALRAEIAASMLAAATAPPLPAPPVEHPGVAFVGKPIGDSMWMGSLGPLPYPAFSVVAGLADDIPDIPTPGELAAQEAEAEALWEQAHSEETVRAAQAEHARQRELLQQLGEEEREEAGTDARTPTPPQTPEAPPLQDASAAVAPASPPAAPARAPVARGRSTKTLAASAATEVVKAPLRGRTAPPPVAPPATSAAPTKPLPLPTWPEKAKAEPPSDPPPKRDRSKNRKVAPRPPEPAQPVLLGMSPETTTPTSIGRPKRRKVAAPAPVAAATKMKAPTKPKKARRPQTEAHDPWTFPAAVLVSASPALRQQLRAALKLCSESRIGVMPLSQGRYLTHGREQDELAAKRLEEKSGAWSASHARAEQSRLDAANRARMTLLTIDLRARAQLVLNNLDKAKACPPFPGMSLEEWREGLEQVLCGTMTVCRWDKKLHSKGTKLNNHFHRHGVTTSLLPDLIGYKGGRYLEQPSRHTHELGRMFGNGLRRLRTKYGLTQIEVAVALELATGAYPPIEQGVYSPRSELVMRICQFFKVTWRELFCITDDAAFVGMLVHGMEHQQQPLACGDLLRHVVLPHFGIVVNTPSSYKVARLRRKISVPSGHNANFNTQHSRANDARTPPIGRIEARPSSISEWSRVRFAVCIGDREIAYADTLKAETPEHVRQLLQNQLLINVRQGGDGLPRGWLASLPDDLGPGVSGRLKEELMELRDQIDNIEHALGLPARYWSGPDQECDADLTDAERQALKAPMRITDRAQLLKDPTEGDSCAEYTSEPATRDCATDGHYLCEGCGRLNRKKRAKSLDHFSPTDESNDDSQE